MTSRTTVLAVVVGLVLIAFTVVAGGMVLVAMDKQVPDALIAIGAGASGALAGVLASTRSTLGPRDTEPQTMVATVTPTTDVRSNLDATALANEVVSKLKVPLATGGIIPKGSTYLVGEGGEMIDPGRRDDV